MSKEVEFNEEFIKVLMMAAAMDYYDNKDTSINIKMVIDATYEKEVEYQKKWINGEIDD